MTFINFIDELGLKSINTNYNVFIYYKTSTLVILYIDNILVINPFRVKI